MIVLLIGEYFFGLKLLIVLALFIRDQRKMEVGSDSSCDVTLAYSIYLRSGRRQRV